MHRRALESLKTMLGKEHPSTLTSMNNLAGVLGRQGKYDEAEAIHRQALESRKTVLGKEHLETLTSVYCLAYLLQDRGQYDDASKFYERALSGFQKKLGVDHPKTLACSGNYTSMLEEQKLQQGNKDLFDNFFHDEGSD
jgi:tetratricopeptide (TPR) repeat protein